MEIRRFGEDKYYVYQISSKWDPQKNRPKKVTGKSIGKITEVDGFILNATGLRLMAEMRITNDVSPVVKNYGAYELMQQLSPDLNNQTKNFFSGIFREIRTISLIRLVDSISSAKMIRPTFIDSYMSDICGDIAVSETSVRKFFLKLVTMQDTIDAFMRSRVMLRTTLLFDGTSIFSRTRDSLATNRYNPNHNRNTQVRVLYVFEKDTHMPVFYQVLQGSIVDKTTFIDTVKVSGCRDCIIIADKGVYSKRSLSVLMEVGVKYILPLQDNTVNAEQSFYEDKDDNKFDDVFSCNHRPVWYRKKASGNNWNFIYTFCDDVRKAELVERYVAKTEKDYGEEEREPKDGLKEIRMGDFSFCSNLDIEPQEIYLA